MPMLISDHKPFFKLFQNLKKNKTIILAIIKKTNNYEAKLAKTKALENRVGFSAQQFEILFS